jgi:multidrug resistance efflux pump
MKKLFVCLLLGGCTAAPAPTMTVSSTVKRSDLVYSGSFFGELEVRTSNPILVPQFDNVWQIAIASVLPDGTPVKKGDTVLSFQPGSFAEDLRSRQSDLALAEASLRKVREQLDEENINKTLQVKRSEMAVELAKLNVIEGVNFISKLDLEKAKVDLAKAELQLELDKKELESLDKKRSAALEMERLKVSSASEKVAKAKTNLESVEIKAPTDGVVYAPYTRLSWVQGKAIPGKVASPGDRVLELPNLDHFNAAIYIRQRDVALVRVGDEASVVVTMFPDKPLKGKVTKKDEFATTRNERLATTTAQGNLKELKAVVELEDSDLALRPGGTVRADITAVLAKDVLVAPLAALKETDGAFSALLANGKSVPVKVGQTTNTHAEILEGLKEGDELRLE